MTSALVGVNATLAGEADQSDLLRGLDGMSRVEQIRAAMVDQAMLLVGAAQKGAFTDREGVACPDVTAVDCETYARAERAAQGYNRAQESLSLSGATPQQRQSVVNAPGLSAFASMASDLMNQGAGNPANGVAGNHLTVSGADALAASTAALERGLQGRHRR